MLLTRIRLSSIPLLRSYEDFVESADYKHSLPPGLVGYG